MKEKKNPIHWQKEGEKTRMNLKKRKNYIRIAN